MNTHRSDFFLKNLLVVGLKIGLQIYVYSITVHVPTIHIPFYIFVTAWFVWTSSMAYLSFVISMPALCVNLIFKSEILMVDFNKQFRWLTS